MMSRIQCHLGRQKVDITGLPRKINMMGIELRINKTPREILRGVFLALLLTMVVGGGSQLTGLLYAQNLERFDDKITDARERISTLESQQERTRTMWVLVQALDSRLDEHDLWLARLNGGAALATGLIIVLQILNMLGLKINVSRNRAPPPVPPPTGSSQ